MWNYNFPWGGSAKDVLKSGSGSLFESVSSGASLSSCAWLQQNLTSQISWTNIASAYLAVSLLVKMPFVVKNMMRHKLEKGRPLFGNAEDRQDLLLLVSMALSTVAGLYAINSGNISLGQLHPVNENMAKFGVALGAITLGSLIWHATLGPSWAALVAKQTDGRPQTRGAYHYARHPLYMHMVLCPVVTFLISQNWLLSSLYLPWLFTAFSNLKREETLMIDVFGQEYVDYKKRVSAFGPLIGKDCGLNEAECAQVLKLHEQRAAVMEAAAKQFGGQAQQKDVSGTVHEIGKQKHKETAVGRD